MPNTAASLILMSKDCVAMSRRVAVIVPVYNAQATVVEALESVYTQSFQDFILVIVDDGSTDNSYSLIEKFANGKVNVVVIKQKNKGLAESRNVAIKYAIKEDIEFIAFLDADDVWHRDKLLYQMRVFDIHPDADMVITKQDEYENADLESTVALEPEKILLYQNLFDTLCLRNFNFHPASILIRTRHFKNIMMFDVRFRSGQDFPAFLNLAYHDLKIFYIDVPLYFQRTLEGSLQRSKGAAYIGFLSRVTAIEEMIEAYADDQKMSPHRMSVLVEAKDNYLCGMLYGARRHFSYSKAFMTAVETFRKYKNKKLFLKELMKTTLYPLHHLRG